MNLYALEELSPNMSFTFRARRLPKHAQTAVIICSRHFRCVHALNGSPELSNGVNR